MKATGIVRRIDDLGRVVIPKEIRRTMNFRDGDPLEIFTDKNGCVIFKKYIPLGSISEQAETVFKVLKKHGITNAIYDSDGTKLFGNPALFPAGFGNDEIDEMEGKYVTIKSDGEVIGYILTKDELTADQKVCIKTAADILTTMMES